VEGRKKWLIGGSIGTGVLLLVLLGMLASGVFKVKTPEGTIVLENLPADAEVTVDKAKVVVKWDNGLKTAQIGVRPGRHKIEATKDGIKVIGEEVEIEDGKRRVLTARLLPPSLPPTDGPQAAAEAAAPEPLEPKNESVKLQRIAEEKEQWVSLFNGKDLTGWKTHPKQSDDWHVKNGILMSGDKPSYLFTERGDYENFHLLVEARINQRGNSGLFFRARHVLGLPHGYEAEIISPRISEPNTGSLFERDTAGISHATVRDGSLMAADKWFTMEIIAEVDHFVIKVNGRTTADCRVNNRQLLRGHFALQKDNRETVVEFRKIEIKELPAATASTNSVYMENSIGMKLVPVKPGTFLMGSPESEEGHDGYEYQHEVEITRPFYVGVYEVTQEQYERVMGKNPSSFSSTGRGKAKVKGMDTRQFPVDFVTWEDAVEFCRQLSELPEEKSKRRTYRLPTEAEWEYVCRGGHLCKLPSQPFHFGNSLSSTQANIFGMHPFGGAPKGPFLGRTTKVGSYPPNPLGVYDLHGNVCEWCADWFDEQYYKQSPRQDPQGPEKGKRHVLRGGCWFVGGILCRAAFRCIDNDPGDRYGGFGFRVVLQPAESPRTDARTPQGLAPPADGFVPLFIGKDLTGWSVDQGDAKQWSVEGNAIIGRSLNAATRSYLLSTKEEYADFTLRLEFKVEPGSNGGIVVRGFEGEKMPTRDGQFTHWHPVVKLTDPAKFPKEPSGTSHWVKDDKEFGKPIENPQLGVGEWHRIEVTFQEEACIALIDGKKVVDLRAEPQRGGAIIPALRRTKGKIGFQAHTGAIHFRDIQIKE
jgi:formylglycine-generating enzyme required for sulfatase activity